MAADPSSSAAADPYDHLEFWHSHYCEKSRWALDYKAVAYRSRVLVPVPHALRVLLTTGQRQVPVLRRGGTTIAGSATIIEHLEAIAPDPPLFPTDPAQRAAVDEHIEWFDRKLGPGIRRAIYHGILHHDAYLNLLMARPYGAIRRAGYRLALPLTKAIMRRSMAIDAEGAERGWDITAQALDRVAAAGDGYLVGDRFTAADLTAAALLYPAAAPAEGPALPDGRPPEVEEWLAHWADHPGVAWVHRVYREHRHRA